MDGQANSTAVIPVTEDPRLNVINQTDSNHAALRLSRE